MLVLALDTCDTRGSLALLHDGSIRGVALHNSELEYSSWLLPAVAKLLTEADVTHSDLTAYAVAAGPGSFTGIRVGLTTVKAWAELFGKPIAAVSRLEALAQSAAGGIFLASVIDAHRGQIFCSLYRRQEEHLVLAIEECVSGPEDFLQAVIGCCSSSPVHWVSPDAHILEGLPVWQARRERGDTITVPEPVFAPAIARLGAQDVLQGKTLDALTLDANYIRRSDAEIFWKSPLAEKSVR